MGACYCQQEVDPNTSEIETRMSQEKRNDMKIHKLLFLGPGGSGKSTIFKQLHWLHLGGFSENDAIRLKQYIYYQIISQMQNIIKYYAKQETYINVAPSQNDADLQNAISFVSNVDDDRALNVELADAIKYIWNHETRIKQAFSDSNVSKFQIIDESTQYFWNELDRIKLDEYIPNQRDILKVRYKTTGVTDEQFAIDDVRLHIFDVGGQKSERKKWMHCFNEVKAVIFVVALSCYNEMMYEDINTNCMVDALELFDETINNKWFEKTQIILFLNKRDLFEKKIKTCPITVCAAFNDFSQFHQETVIHPNPNDYEQTTQYIQHKFHVLKRSKKQQIYIHFTYAMDRQNISNVFIDVKSILIRANLASQGLSG